MKGWEEIRRLTGSRWSGWCERSLNGGSRTTPSPRSAISRLLLLVQELSPAHAAPAPPPHCPLRAQTPEAMEVDMCKTSSTTPMALLSIPTLNDHLMSAFPFILCTLYINIYINGTSIIKQECILSINQGTVALTLISFRPGTKQSRSKFMHKGHF